MFGPCGEGTSSYFSHYTLFPYSNKQLLVVLTSYKVAIRLMQYLFPSHLRPELLPTAPWALEAHHRRPTSAPRVRRRGVALLRVVTCVARRETNRPPFRFGEGPDAFRSAVEMARVGCSWSSFRQRHPTEWKGCSRGGRGPRDVLFGFQLRRWGRLRFSLWGVHSSSEEQQK